MASGEESVRLASANIQVEVSNILVTDLSNTVFSTPYTTAQSFSGAIPPKLALGPNGLSSCYSPETGYAELSLLQWSNNPYLNSQSIQAPLIRFTTTTTITTNTTEKVALASLDKAAVISLLGVPDNTISLQFSVIQDFNFTAGLAGLKNSNFTLPACTLYDGVKYVACKGGNISSYTNSNVTYGCFDMTQLCPSSLVSVRRNLQSNEINNDINIDSRGSRNFALVAENLEDVLLME